MDSGSQKTAAVAFHFMVVAPFTNNNGEPCQIGRRIFSPVNAQGQRVA